MVTALGKRIVRHDENFNQELQNTKKNKTEFKNTKTEMKDTLKGINSRLGDTEECISDLGDRIMEITQSKQEKKIF